MRHQLLITYEHTSTCDAEGCVVVYLYFMAIPFGPAQPFPSRNKPRPSTFAFFLVRKGLCSFSLLLLQVLELLASSSGWIM
jgi:hypothetical protein